MSRTLIRQIFFVLLLSVCLHSQARAFELSTAEQEYLSKKGTVIFVSQTNYPPFEFRDANGQREGMMLDLVRWIAVEAGFRPVFEDMTFLQAQLAVKQGKADVLTSLFYSEARSQHFEFTIPLFEVPAYLYIQTNRDDIKDLTGLNPKSIAIQRGDYAKDFLEEHKIPFTPVDTADFAEALKLVISGKADALIGDQQIVAYHLFRNEQTNRLKTVGEPLYVGQNCMAAAKNQDVLIGILNKGIAEAAKKGILRKITVKWLGNQPNGTTKSFWNQNTFLLLGCIAALVLIVLYIYWRNTHLRTLVDQKSQSLASTEKALQQSEKNFGLFFQTIDDLILVADNEGHILYSNPAVTDKLGFSPQELSTMNLLDLHQQSDRSEAALIVAEMMRGERQNCPLPVRGKNGNLLPVETKVWTGEWNGMPCLYGLCKDLSNEQEALQKFNRLFDNNPAIMALSTIDTHEFCDINKTFTATLGFSREDAIGKTPDDLHLFVDPVQQQICRDKLMQKGSLANCELLVRRKDGKILSGLFAGELITSQGKCYFLTVMIDLSRQKQAEQALRLSEQQYRKLFDSLIDVYYRIDQDGRFVMISPSITRLTGFSQAEIIGKNARDFYVKPDERRLAATLLRNQDLLENVRIQMRKKDDSQLWVSCNARVTRDDTGRIIEIEGIARDITDRKRVEEESTRQQRRLASILEGTNCGTWEWNIETGEIVINSRWAEIVGYTLDELTPFTCAAWAKYIHPDDLPQIKNRLIAHFKDQAPFYEYEYRIRHRDGRWLWVIHRGQVLSRSESGRALMMFGTQHDISDKKQKEEDKLRLERGLLQSQKNESLGRMAGAIAHHFNNLLAGIMGNLEIALEEKSDNATLQDCLKKSIQSSERAAALSHLMLTYLGHNISEKKMCSLGAEVAGTLPLIEASLPANVTLKKSLAPDKERVFADPGAIRQTLVNLTVNAWEALGENGGEITIATGCKVYDEASLQRADQLHNPQPGKYCFLKVSDTGCGMNQQTVELMFDPFFSTKFTGRGLGLATVAGMVRSCQGTTIVSSRKNLGTTIEVLLPVYDTQAESVSPAQASPAARDLRSVTILVADDEEFILDLTTSMIKNMNMQVLAAQDGFEAIRLFEEHSQEIDLALLDLSMPGLNGWEVLQRIRALQPSLPVILVSGYSEEQVKQHIFTEQPQLFLSKPFKIAELRKALSSLLKHPSSPQA